MTAAITIFFALMGGPSLDPDYSALGAFSDRHGLVAEQQQVVTGDLGRIADLGYRIDDEFRAYRGDFVSTDAARAFFATELGHSEAIAILAHPDRYAPREDVLLSYDAPVVAEMQGAGFAAAVPNPAQPDAFAALLLGTPGRAAEIAEAVDDEMFGGPDDAPDLVSAERLVPETLLRPGAVPFPVVLGRGAIVGGWTGPGQPMAPLEVMDRITALMGGLRYQIDMQGDALVGGQYEAADSAIEFSVVNGPIADGAPHPGPAVEIQQYFDAVEEEAESPVEETIEDGLRVLANEIGLSLAIEVPYNASSGELAGFARAADGTLSEVRLPYDAEAGD